MTVTFLENDNASDTVSTFQISPLDQSEDLTPFADLSPAFSDPGYTFAGWNTAANGTGTSYADGAIYSFSGSVVLYAQWSSVPSIKTVTFLENDSSLDTVSTFQIGSAAEDLTPFADLSPAFSDPGYTFAGWNTAANGTGTSYADGAIYSFSGSVVLYAQWNPLPSSTITFNDNGGAGSVSSLSAPSGASITLPSGSGLSFSGYSFSGWNTAANGSGTPYSAAQSFQVGSSETLYAQWAAVSGSNNSSPGSTSDVTPTTTPSVTVNFAANGGSGSLATLEGTSGENLILPSPSSVVRVGYTLTSWNTEANGNGVSYKPGASVNLSSSVTLYAQWTSTGAAPAVLYGAIGEFPKDSTTLSPSLERQVRDLATFLKAKHYTVVKLYGYTAATGLASLDHSLSTGRAQTVAGYLRVALGSLKVSGVSIKAAGEGSLTGKSSPLYSRVEVFVS